MRSLVYICCGMEEKKLLTLIGTISLMHILCMFRLIEVKTQPKHITNCLLCVHSLVILYSIENNNKEKKSSSSSCLDIGNSSCLSRDCNSIWISRFFLVPLIILKIKREREKKTCFSNIYTLKMWHDRLDGIRTFSFSSLHLCQFFFSLTSVNWIFCLVCSISLHYLFSIIDKVFSRVCARARVRRHHRVFKLSEREWNH